VPNPHLSLTGGQAGPAATSNPGLQTASLIAPAAHAPSGAGSVAGMLGSLAVVVGLILALAWLARKLQGARASRGGLLQVTGGVAVGSKERVVIVRIGGEHFLVGVAAGNVTLLHRFAGEPGTSAMADATEPEAAAAATPFADRLREMLRARKAA